MSDKKRKHLPIMNTKENTNQRLHFSWSSRVLWLRVQNVQELLRAGVSEFINMDGQQGKSFLIFLTGYWLTSWHIPDGSHPAGRITSFRRRRGMNWRYWCLNLNKGRQGSKRTCENININDRQGNSFSSHFHRITWHISMSLSQQEESSFRKWGIYWCLNGH